METLTKDVLVHLCNFMTVHTSHNLMICCKQIWIKTKDHPNRNFRCNIIGCLEPQERFETALDYPYLKRFFSNHTCYNHRNRRDCDTYCMKCNLWFNHQNILIHKNRCDNRVQSSVIMLPNSDEKYGRCDCFLVEQHNFIGVAAKRHTGPHTGPILLLK